MEPLLSTLPARTTPNEPHNLLARLYREIGISAVAAALQIPDARVADTHGFDVMQKADPQATRSALEADRAA